MPGVRGTGRKHGEADDGRSPSRQLDEEKTGQRAKAPPNVIRQPVKLPPMERIQGG
jgi:hypothetical protein